MSWNHRVGMIKRILNTLVGRWDEVYIHPNSKEVSQDFVLEYHYIDNKFWVDNVTFTASEVGEIIVTPDRVDIYLLEPKG